VSLTQKINIEEVKGILVLLLSLYIRLDEEKKKDYIIVRRKQQ